MPVRKPFSRTENVLEKLCDQHCRKYMYTGIYNHNCKENLFTEKKNASEKTLKSTVKCFLEITNAREVNPSLRH